MTDPVTEHRDPSPTADDATEDDQPLVEADLLVEDVSIDGMCGVY
ncbi:MAG TPA: mycofactocin precursor MftA [Acidimicrobiales bacterium]|jgi:mycofactocin precursor|nr:mycofactocin precursor MftA [Acidimicrobiales bacterium]